MQNNFFLFDYYDSPVFVNYSYVLTTLSFVVVTLVSITSKYVS